MSNQKISLEKVNSSRKGKPRWQEEQTVVWRRRKF